MKLKTRALALLTVATLTVASLGMTAFAKEDKNGNILPDAIALKPNDSKRTLTKGKSITYSYDIRPSDADYQIDVSWDSSDYDVAEVDDNGYVTAVGPGTCTITVTTENRKKDSVEITVPGKVSDSSDLSTLQGRDGVDIDVSSSSSSSKSSSSAAESVAATSVKAPRETVVNGVKSAGTGTALFNSYTSVSADTLQAAAAASSAKVAFDTKSSKAVIGRVTITPANASKLKGDIALGVHTNDAKVKSVQTMLDKYFSNSAKAIYCEQENYGMTVKITAKVGDLNDGNLRFYSYDKAKNKLTAITVSDAKIDANGYLSFNTSVGGYIVASNGPLTAK